MAIRAFGVRLIKSRIANRAGAHPVWRVIIFAVAVTASLATLSVDNYALSGETLPTTPDDQLEIKEQAAQEILLLLHAMTLRPNALNGIQNALPEDYLQQTLVAELKQLLGEIEILKQHPAAKDTGEVEKDASTHENTVDELVARLGQESKQPLGDSKQQFSWPLEGRIISTPGNAFRRGGAKWPGVLIGAKAGSEVKAIASGIVVYAGEMKHLGLLVILDHQDGHLSLYGRNTELFVKQNDRIVENQTLAIVDHAAGNEQSALYFEVRRHGTPIDPRLVCSKTIK